MTQSSLIRIIDPHVHFFDLSKGRYQWLNTLASTNAAKAAILYKNFSEADLILPPNWRLERLCHIEAGFDNTNPTAELEFLNDQVQTPYVAVISLPLDSEPLVFISSFRHLLSSRFANRLVGVRHIMERQAVNALYSPHLLTNLAELERFELIWEAQFDVTNAEALAAFLALAKTLPTLKITLNHCCFPTPENLFKWQQAIVQLAPIDHLRIKFSGFAMIEPTPTRQGLDDAFISQVFVFLSQTIGIDRLLFASNFPLCLQRWSYLDLWCFYRQMVQKISVSAENDWAKLSYDNAFNWYFR